MTAVTGEVAVAVERRTSHLDMNGKRLTGLPSAVDLSDAVSKASVDGAIAALVANLPTSDPAVAGALWYDGTALQISAGSP